jgi:hypothetical protein
MMPMITVVGVRIVRCADVFGFVAAPACKVVVVLHTIGNGVAALRLPACTGIRELAIRNPSR